MSMGHRDGRRPWGILRVSWRHGLCWRTRVCIQSFWCLIWEGFVALTFAHVRLGWMLLACVACCHRMLRLQLSYVALAYSTDLWCYNCKCCVVRGFCFSRYANVRSTYLKHFFVLFLYYFHVIVWLLSSSVGWQDVWFALAHWYLHIFNCIVSILLVWNAVFAHFAFDKFVNKVMDGK